MISLMDLIQLFQDHVWGVTVKGESIKNIPYENIRTLKYEADNLRPTIEVIKSKYATCLDYALAVERLCGGKIYRIQHHSHAIARVGDLYTDFGECGVHLFHPQEIKDWGCKLIEITNLNPKHRNDIFTK